MTCRSPWLTPLRAGPLHPGTSDVDFLGDFESVVDLYTKVANCAFDLRMAEKSWNRAGFRCGGK